MTYQPNNKQMNAGTRLASMILDHFFMTFIAMIFFIPEMINFFSAAFKISHEQSAGDGFSGPSSYLIIWGLALYLCKDSFNGRSIAKRILKLQVVDNNTGEAASPLRCFVRNIFCFIWPVEVIVTLINPSRRIGDRVAGTKTVFYDASITEQSKVNIINLLITLAIAYGLLFLALQPFKSLSPSTHRVKYIESSYNDIESKALEKVFADSLGKYFTASVKAYDKIEHQNLKYISIILELKENYLEDEANKSELQRLTAMAVHTVFARDSFTGRVQFVYRSGTNLQTLTTPIGRKLTDTIK